MLTPTPYFYKVSLFNYKNYMPSTTNDLTQSILRFLFNQHVFAWRNNSGGIIDKKTGSFRTGAKSGTSDILACHDSVFIGIEIKTGKDKLRPEQIGFIKSIQSCGGVAIVTSTFEDFLNKWELYTTTRFSSEVNTTRLKTSLEHINDILTKK